MLGMAQICQKSSIHGYILQLQLRMHIDLLVNFYELLSLWKEKKKSPIPKKRATKDSERK